MATSNLFIAPEQGWVLAASGPLGFVRISAPAKNAAFFVALASSLPAASVIGQSIHCTKFWVNTNITDNVYVRVNNGVEYDTGSGGTYGTLGTRGLRLDIVTGPTNATGGGGGGGGAVTIADGADTAEGATTASAYTDTTGASAGTVIGLLKGLYVKITSTLKVSFGQSTTSTYTDISGSITTGGTAQTIQASTSARIGFEIENTSTGDLWFNTLATAVAASPSIRIPSGMIYTTPTSVSPTGAISIIGATTGQTFTARSW